MALHDINIALQFENVILLKDGEVLGSGDPGEVLSGSMIRSAFGVEIEVRKAEHGSYITHGKWF
jgi:ABC-type cobalamin/Fe3+-siderophores transport system ATPase subunit